MAYISTGTNEYGMPDLRLLPTQEIVAGFVVKPGEILGQTKPGSVIEHRLLIGYHGIVFHSPGPGDVFRRSTLQEVLAPGGQIRIVHTTSSLQETQQRLARAELIMGVPWWNMNCHQTTDFVVGVRDIWPS
jgi:hypothetical protein